MKNLISLMKDVEICLRSNSQFDKEMYSRFSELSDWEYRIIQDFILRVNMSMQRGDLNFQYKYFESKMNEPFKPKTKVCDLFIATLKRERTDTVLTDVINRLVIPKELTWRNIDMWGLQVTAARNKAVEEACKLGAKYLLFIDDDIVAPNNALMKLYDIIKKYDWPVVAGDYNRKVEPQMSAHGNLEEFENGLSKTDLCAMGFTLIDIEKVSEKVPFPLFWEFGAPDGYWSMGEDAFFTRNILEYLGEEYKPIVDASIKLLHFDKVWKKTYGERDMNVTYASNAILDKDQFREIRKPPKFPSILIGIPTRKKGDPISCNLDKLLLLRGYRSEFYNVTDLDVDKARINCAEEAVKNGHDYLLFIDDDIIPPEDGLVKMLDLMERNITAGVVTGDYLLKGKVSHSAHLQLDKDGLCTELNRLSDTSNIIESNWMIGLGFALINTEVFKQIRAPWFLNNSDKKDETNVGEDAFFTELVLQSGYKILIDRSVQCAHVDYKTQIVYGYELFLDRAKMACFDWAYDFKYESGAGEEIKKNLKPSFIPHIIMGIPKRKGDDFLATDIATIVRPKGYKVECLFPRGYKVAEARNLIIKEALKEKADYVFFIDDDVKVPPNALLELLDMNCDVAALSYPLKQDVYQEAILVDEGECGIRSLDKSTLAKKNNNKRIICGPFWAVTMGCTLIKASVLRKIGYPWFFENTTSDINNFTEDVFFTQKCNENNIQIKVNLDIRCGHMDKESGKVYSFSDAGTN